MFVPLEIVTDYSLLTSLIKIKDLIGFLKEHNYPSGAICDDNLFGVREFYTGCVSNNLKPIIGLKIIMQNLELNLYAKNYLGYQKLLKINTLKQKKEVDFEDIKDDNIIVIVPFKSLSLFELVLNFKFIGYTTEQERLEALEITKKVVFINKTLSLKKADLKYLNYLKLLKAGKDLNSKEDSTDFNYFPDINTLSWEDRQTTFTFADLIDFYWPEKQRYIPEFENSFHDSYRYLVTLSKKGLEKRLNNQVEEIYAERLKYELEVIHKMGFVDYFLIVYDYVLFAKKNHILANVRGSAAGSLVSYSLGITNIDPIKYQLLFERFLNPERITMPDIDMDFEYTKRNLVIDYVKEKYGKDKVALIITFGTLAAKQALRDVGKIFLIDSNLLDNLVKNISAKDSLIVNSKNPLIKKYLVNYPELQKVYQVALKFEGLKRHISTHAAGVVICNQTLDNIIPIYLNGEEILTGITMEYLEDLGLLKMDFLALKNLTIIQNVLDLVKLYENKEINLNTIPLDKEKVYSLFQTADTEGIFQFESAGMKNLICKLKPTCFSDLVACIALFRPGPMDNIDEFIKRKNNPLKIDYLHPSLKEILAETYGIIVYQEQIMQILVKMAKFSFAQADNIRRAMSKKKIEIIEKEKANFIKEAVKNGYEQDLSEKVYNLILKFANYGFNKAHSVSYSLMAYQMAYLKAVYPLYFITNLLNMSIGSEIKTKEYLDEAKRVEIKILAIDINESEMAYKIMGNDILLPLSIIKNIGSNLCQVIVEERKLKGLYKDFCDFVARTYKKGINKLVLEALINVNAFKSFSHNRKTLRENILLAINYATLINDLDESLVMKPEFELLAEDEEDILRTNEFNSLGFYLTDHPASKYQNKEIIKAHIIKDYFDKNINMIILIEDIHQIKTKKDEKMAFIKGSDETGTIDGVIFPNYLKILEGIEEKALIKIFGKVTKRFDKYNINIVKIEQL